MPSKVWNDINLPGFSQSKEENVERKRITGVEDSSPDDKPEYEVRIVSAEWIPGSKGFQYNEQCFVDVTAEYLVETNRARITGNLFGIYDGVEVDLGLSASGCIDDSTMIARIAIPKLYFINNDHYAAWQEDKCVPCQYVLKGITHSLGANSIDSPVLDMPNKETAELKTFSVKLKLNPGDPDCQKFKFTLYSTDDDKSYEQVKTVSDDALQNNDTTELLFTDLDKNLIYTLELDAGDGNPPKILLGNRAYGKWAGAVDSLEEDTKASGSEKGSAFKKAGGIKNNLSKKADSVKNTINDKAAKANDLKSGVASSINEKVVAARDIKDQTQTIAMTELETIKQSADAIVNNARSQVDDIKQNAAQTVSDGKFRVDDVKQNVTQTVNNAKSQVDDIKQDAAQTVNNAKSQVNDVKQNFAQTVNDTKSQVNDIKQNAAQTVNNVKSQTDNLKKQADSAASLKDKLAAINTTRENAQNAAAAKDKVSNFADSLKSVPTFKI
jgi:hypothetical protein